MEDVWKPASVRCGLEPRPHEFRHSFVTHMRAAGVDDADLAAITGHTVLTMLRGYSHSLGRSFETVRKAVGE
jgi:integrase